MGGAKSDNKKSPDWRRALANGFILFHLIALGAWGMPASGFRNLIARPFEKYILKFGFWHVWDMFAPIPLKMNFDLDAKLEFRDGSVRLWQFPRMEELGMVERFRKERFRKWRERVRLDDYSVVWPDTCRYIARMHNNPTNPPTRISITRHWAPIPLPVKGDYQPIPKSYPMPSSYTFTVYDVQPEDLR